MEVIMLGESVPCIYVYSWPNRLHYIKYVYIIRILCTGNKLQNFIELLQINKKKKNIQEFKTQFIVNLLIVTRGMAHYTILLLLLYHRFGLFRNDRFYIMSSVREQPYCIYDVIIRVRPKNSCLMFTMHV